MPLRERGHGLEVGDGEERVGGRLDEKRLDVWRDRLLKCGDVIRVLKRIGEAERVEHLVEDAERAAIDVLREEDAVARPEERQDGCDSGHAGAESEAVRAAFKVGDEFLKCRARRVARARILPAGRFAQRPLAIGGGLVDGDVDGSGRFVAVDAAVDCKS